MRGREKFGKVKGIIGLLISFYLLFPKKVRIKLFVHHRNTKGNTGIAIRYALLKTLAVHVGENVLIKEDVYILNPSGLTVGDNVSIHPFCYLECIGGITIGNDVSIAEGTSIISFDHNYENTSIPIKDQGITRKAISIANDVWIGAKATLLGGVTVENGAIIAAGAVVNADVKKYSIVGGVPAKEIKTRKKEE